MLPRGRSARPHGSGERAGVAASLRRRYTSAIERTIDTRDVVVMFAREPEPGAVKTRLVPALGAQRAATLYRAFTEDLCALVSERFRLALACTPSVDSAYFGRLARRYGLALVPQGEGDLGARMHRTAAHVLTRAKRVVLIGSDAPTLPLARIDDAFHCLRRTRVAIGPSLDGGYYLLGLRAPVPPIFTGMRWGNQHVLRRTLARLRRRRIPHAVLDCWYDVDTRADLDLLQRHLFMLATAGSVPCPRTQRALRSHGHMQRQRRGAEARTSAERATATRPGRAR